MRYSVPRGNREFASWPDVDKLPQLVRKNIDLRASHSFKILDLDVTEFRQKCLEDARNAAREYADQLAIPCPSLDRAPIVATGHQPELYHCGVWIKNHLAARLAQSLGGSSLNLIVDNDVPKHLGLPLPVCRGRSWHKAEAAFMSRRPDRPFEEYPSKLENPAGFQKEVVSLAKDAPFEANAAALAARLVAADGTGTTLADVTTATRLSFEREVGLANAELPVSRLSATPAFAAFAASILVDGRRFAESYNAALGEYRRRNRVRNRANPLPDLAVESDRAEAAFWVWREAGPRGRLFVKDGGGGEVSLFTEEGRIGALDAGGFDRAGQSWRELMRAGYRIRPRALTTTILMRMFLADLFIHGIGGAKYDEVTDSIIRKFYGQEPPPYATISATLMLGWDFEPADAGAPGRLKNEIRDMDYNPQRHIPEEALSAPERDLVAEKWRLAGAGPADAQGRRGKFVRIREINGQLAMRLRESRRHKREELAEVRRRIAADAVAFSREYSCFVVGAAAASEFYNEALRTLGPKSS